MPRFISPEVHRGAAPYFAPARAATEAATVPATAQLIYSDPNGSGDPNAQHFYLVRAFNCTAITAADGNRTGAFGLVKGA